MFSPITDIRRSILTQDTKKKSGNYNQKWASPRIVVSAKDMQYYWVTGEGNK